MTNRPPTPPAAILYEHADGRRAVVSANRLATFAIDNPDWHRAGPVEIVWVDETAPAWRPIETAPQPAVQQGWDIDAAVEKAWGRFQAAMDKDEPLPPPSIHATAHYGTWLGREAHRHDEPKAGAFRNAARMLAVLEAEIRRLHAELIAAHPAAPVAQGDALTPADADQLEKVITDFEEYGETDVPYAALQRYAAMGYLECAHYHVLPAAHEAIAVARAQAKEGA